MIYSAPDTPHNCSLSRIQGDLSIRGQQRNKNIKTHRVKDGIVIKKHLFSHNTGPRDVTLIHLETQSSTVLKKVVYSLWKEKLHKSFIKRTAIS